jgi:hypothetical protein
MSGTRKTQKRPRLGRMYAGRDLKLNFALWKSEEALKVNFLCLGLPQLAPLKVRFLRLAF